MSNKLQLLTAQAAAERLKLSTRRLADLAGEGKLTRHRAFDSVTKREAFMFDAAEIEAYAERRLYEAAGLPDVLKLGDIAAPSRALMVRPRAPIDDDKPAAAGVLRPWLTIAEAAEYSGLPASYLLGLIEADELRARHVGVRPGGQWRVRKLDLDAIEGEFSTD